MSDAEQSKQVTFPDYHGRNHTAARTCGWTANALRGDGRLAGAPPDRADEARSVSDE